MSKRLRRAENGRENVPFSIKLSILIVCLCVTVVSTKSYGSSNRLKRATPEVIDEHTESNVNAPDFQTNLPNGEDPDPVVRERRNKIREVSFEFIFKKKVLHLTG